MASGAKNASRASRECGWWRYATELSTDEGTLAGRRFGITATIRRLLTEELDALFVCLTNDIAAEVTIAALQNGLHVFCEKPPGRNVDDIVRVIACERQHPALKLMYGFNHRYHESVQDALKILRSGELGARDQHAWHVR